MRNEGIFAGTTLFCLILVAFGVGSAAWEWAKARRRAMSPRSSFPSPRRFIRRLFTSAVLILLGVMVWSGVHWVDSSSPGLRFLGYWGIVLLLIVWLFLCPLFDVMETQRAYRRRLQALEDQTTEVPAPEGEPPRSCQPMGSRSMRPEPMRAEAGERKGAASGSEERGSIGTKE